jgi:hypothetical protein
MDPHKKIFSYQRIQVLSFFLMIRATANASSHDFHLGLLLEFEATGLDNCIDNGQDVLYAEHICTCALTCHSRRRIKVEQLQRR